MQQPEERVVKFIRKHHVFSLATCYNGIPWCASCFYAYRSADVKLVFTSDLHTRHVTELMKNPAVAGNIHLETKIVGKIRGIQITGEVEMPNENELNEVRLLYLKRFPYAIVMNTHFWIFKIDTLKMTDNLLGFGKKIYWKRHEN